MYDRRVDGTKSYYGVEFHLKKERKIERLLNCLDDCHFEYKITKQSNGSTKIRIYNKDGINIVTDICEKWLHNKCFTWDWLNLSEKQAHLLLDEILLWDGCTAANLYCSKKNINLDIISAIAALNGVGSNVTGSNVQFRENPYITLGPAKRNNKRSGDQTLVSCVTVKTGIFLCRQNGKTFIVGNCPGDWLYSRLGDVATQVTARLGGSAVVNPGDTVSSFPAVPFTVQVIVNDLNYRSEPSMDGKVNGQTGKGVFTIVEVKDGWGRLKSGVGWIWLENPSYCTVNKTTSTTKTVDELAREVLNGAWGNGEDRKQRLTAAGYDYSAVQAKVNELMGAATPTKSIDELAREVIAGKWGNGAERKNRLTAAGYDYSVVQNRVNQILKK